jgi:nicotinamidase-related amidase
MKLTLFSAIAVLLLFDPTTATSSRGSYDSPSTNSNSNNYPSTNSNSNKFTQLLNPNDTILLMLDHQTGLLQTVHDQPVREARILAGVLIKAAALQGIPILSTASEPTGPNGPLFPELATYANSTFIHRRGEISAWDNPNFYAAVKRSGRKTLIMAGIWLSVCVTFPALQAVGEGYKVYAVVDASGDPTPMSSNAAQLRMQQAGVILTSVNAVVSELQRTWCRPDAAQWAVLYGEESPNYQLLIESANSDSCSC